MRPRIYYTESQRALMWERWQKGDSLHQIARLFDRNHPSIARILGETGGIRPAPRKRSRLALTLAEREEISRAVVAGHCMRSIAVHLGRAPSTISREPLLAKRLEPSWRHLRERVGTGTASDATFRAPHKCSTDCADTQPMAACQRPFRSPKRRCACRARAQSSLLGAPLFELPGPQPRRNVRSPWISRVLSWTSLDQLWFVSRIIVDGPHVCHGPINGPKIIPASLKSTPYVDLGDIMSPLLDALGNPSQGEPWGR